MTHPVPWLLRVDATGVVIAANPQARRMLGSCEGRPCHAVVGARARDGDAMCVSSCAAELALRPGATRERAGVVVRQRIGRLTCSRVGQETVVVLAVGPASARRYPEALTRRERDVLRLVAEGRTNRQVGELLVISSATVRTHVEHALAKLGASTRTEAVLVAKELGEI